MPARITNLHAIEELLKRGNVSAELIVDPKRGQIKSRLKHLIDLAERSGVRVVFASAEEMHRSLGRGEHRGAVLNLEDSAGVSLKTTLKQLREPQQLVLVLDSITDPHNLGAILRSADQFSVDAVVISAHRSAKETETVAGVSAGASAWVTVTVESNIRNAIDLLKKEGFWVFGADMQGDPITQIRLEGQIAIVLGSEGNGLRRLVRESCDRLISIPSSGHVDSFNVSVAASILMYEVRRQQGYFSVD